jgi:hypothetical protein
MSNTEKRGQSVHMCSFAEIRMGKKQIWTLPDEARSHEGPFCTYARTDPFSGLTEANVKVICQPDLLSFLSDNGIPTPPECGKTIKISCK